MRNVREADITNAKSLAARVQGPLKGPGSSGVLDALWCNLSLIWGAFYPTNVFIYFYYLFIIHFLSNTTWAGENQTQAGDRDILENFASKRESWSKSVYRVCICNKMITGVLKNHGCTFGALSIFWVCVPKYCIKRTCTCALHRSERHCLTMIPL